MQALVCTSPGELRLEHRPEPLRGEGDVLVRPRRIGICGTDYHIYEGKHPFLNYPRVMGHELAVEVIEAPPESGWQAGEICVVNPYVSCGVCVACRAGRPNCCERIAVLGVHRDGGMASLLTLPAKNLVRAEGLGLDACATVEFLAIGAHANRRGQVESRDAVLVRGAGPIGLGVALFATLTGAAVTVADLSEERREAAARILKVDTVDAADEDALREANRGNGFDIVFDATGNPRSMESGFNQVAHAGRYVLVSVVKGPIAFEDADFHRKEMTLFGSRNALAVDFEQVIAEIRNGRVPIEALITHRTSLQDATTKLPLWATQKTGLIKAVITLDDGGQLGGA